MILHRIRTALIILLLGLIAIFIQGAILKPFMSDAIIPNLILMLVVFLAFYENSPFGAFLAFLLGLEFDLYSGHPQLVGPTAGAFVAVYVTLASLSQRIFVDSAFAVIVVSVFSSILSAIIFSILVYEFNSSNVRFFSFSLVSAIITGCIAPPTFSILRYLLLRKWLLLGGRSRAVSV